MKTIKVLISKGIGNGVALSPNGVATLHEMKYEETHFFKLAGDDTFHKVNRKEFIDKSDLWNYGVVYFVTHLHIAEGLSLEQLSNKCVLSLMFDGDWRYPTQDSQRTDEHLIKLFNSGDKRQFKYDTLEEYKLVEVPEDVEWYVASDEMGHEWVQEKSRSWN